MDRLCELEEAYSHMSFQHTYWKDYQSGIPLDLFRNEFYLGDRTNEYSYDYARSVDRDGWLDKLDEDAAFGAQPTMIRGRLASRDLVDSVLELRFARDAIGPELEKARILDIGAGYGRLAYRITSLWPEAEVYCTDAVAASTRVCELYLEHRKARRAYTVPFHELGKIPRVDVAVNVHSWSECTLEAISFWLDLIDEKRAKWLMIVPHRASTIGEHLHPEPLLSCESVNASRTESVKRPYEYMLRERGWKVHACAKKYAGDPAGHCEPTTYWMFRR
jgi:putative sugar O-methyltransferase